MNDLEELSKLALAVSIQVNDHKTVYETVSAALDHADIDDEVRKVMVDKDRIIRIDVYPIFATGFYTFYHHDLTEAVKEALETVKAEQKAWAEVRSKQMKLKPTAMKEADAQ